MQTPRARRAESAILTGRYPERSGFRPVGPEIPQEFPTIAEELRGRWIRNLSHRKMACRRRGHPRLASITKGLISGLVSSTSGSCRGKSRRLTRQERRPTYNNPMLQGKRWRAKALRRTSYRHFNRLILVEVVRALKRGETSPGFCTTHSWRHTSRYSPLRAIAAQFP